MPEVGEDVFYQPYIDSYGSSIHRVFTFNSPAIELFNPTKELKINDPKLLNQFKKIKSIYRDKSGQWGMVSPFLREDEALKKIGILMNLSGIKRTIYEDMLIPMYQQLLQEAGLNTQELLIGSSDSFIEKQFEKARSVFSQFINRHVDGLSISISENDVSVRDFVGERHLSGGLLKSTSYPYEPVFVSAAINQRSVLNEVEILIRSDASESKLEDFLVVHYKDIFGSKYDRIETQLWLRFPEIDITVLICAGNGPTFGLNPWGWTNEGSRFKPLAERVVLRIY